MSKEDKFDRWISDSLMNTRQLESESEQSAENDSVSESEKRSERIIKCLPGSQVSFCKFDNLFLNLHYKIWPNPRWEREESSGY